MSTLDTFKVLPPNCEMQRSKIQYMVNENDGNILLNKHARTGGKPSSQTTSKMYDPHSLGGSYAESRYRGLRRWWQAQI